MVERFQATWQIKIKVAGMLEILSNEEHFSGGQMAAGSKPAKVHTAGG
jgi:hypothetical protein